MLHNVTLQALLTYNKCLKDKQIATKEHKCPNKILLIKVIKSLKKNRTVRPRIATMNQIKKMKQSYNDIAFVFSVWHSGQSFCKSNFIIVTTMRDKSVDTVP